VIINKHKDGIGSEIVGKSSEIIVRKTVSANNVVVTYDTRSPDSTGNINTCKRLCFIRNSPTSSMEQMNTNKKNEYYSSEDTVKVKIGEKLTWKRVVVFFDRLYISFCAYILQHSSLNLLSLHYSNKEHDCRDKRNYE
jgi:hypothetical protein